MRGPVSMLSCGFVLILLGVTAVTTSGDTPDKLGKGDHDAPSTQPADHPRPPDRDAPADPGLPVPTRQPTPDPGPGPLPPPVPAGKVLLQQKFAPGNYLVEVVTETETTGPQVIRNSTATHVAMQIGPAAADGRTPVRMVILQMQSMTDAAGIRMGFDTANPQASNEPMAAVMAGLTNQPFDLLVRSSGHVDEIRGLDEALRRASQGNEAAAALLVGMKDSIRLGLESVLMTNVGRLFSDRPVGPGDTWNAKLRIAPPGMPESEIDGKASLVSVNGPAAQVHFEGKSLPNTQLPPGYAVEFSLSADYLLDLQSGMVMGGTGKSNFLTVTPSGSTKVASSTGITVQRR